MRLHLIFLGAVFFLFVIISSINISSEVTGESVTGEVTTQSVGLNISIFLPLPTLTLITPENETYIDNQTILLNYSTTFATSIWYNLDNLANTTITDNTQFSASEGSHTLNLYANNSKGVVTQNVTFFVNSTKFRILYEEYKGEGSTTNFSVYSYEDLQDIGNVTLENTNFGKIIFNETINMTDDEDFSDKLLDLDTHTNISSNRIELNSTALPNFNKSATLSLYNLSFSDPRILKDDSVCPSTICTEIDYSGGTLLFNVSEFTVYSAEETPGEVPPVTTGGRGGGGGITKKVEEDIFKVDKEIIKVKLKRTREVSVPLTIVNVYDSDLLVEIESSLQKKEPSVRGLSLIVEEKVKIEKGGSKEIKLIFKAGEGLKLGVYVEKIILKTKVGDTEKVKEVPAIIEIESEKVIFDVSVDIPPKYREVFAGEKLLVQPTIFNLGEVEETDVLINYLIKDFEGNTIFFEEEKIKVGDQASFSKKIQIPEDTEPGDYVFVMQTIYLDSVGTSSNIFRVKVERSFLGKYWIPLTSILIIILSLCIIIILRQKQKKIQDSVNLYKEKLLDDSKKIREVYKRKLSDESKKIRERTLAEIRKAKESKRIKEKIGALEKAYIGGYIKRETYEKIKKRMRDLLKG